MLNNARLEVEGRTIDPIPPESLTPAAQSILVGMKPLFATILGKVGQSLEIIVYSSMQEGKKLIDPLKPGSFHYTLYDQTFTWRLPLGSLLPIKMDPNTGRRIPG